jgi:hypothetical protein
MAHTTCGAISIDGYAEVLADPFNGWNASAQRPITEHAEVRGMLLTI